MAMNKMNALLDKVERRLRTRPLILPEVIKKDKWVEGTIIPDTILTFSRFFPYKVTIKINTKDKTKRTKDGYYIIDNALLGGQEILGVKDICWEEYGIDGGLAQSGGVGVYDYLSTYANYSMDDVMLLQARADMTSIFNNTIFVKFKEPNLIRLESVTGGEISGGLETLPLDIFVPHPSNLMTISPTKMETFENLATSDVANFLLTELKYYDDLETVFAGVDYKLDHLERWADRRDDFVNELKESYVGAANENQPLMYCV